MAQYERRVYLLGGILGAGGGLVVAAMRRADEYWVVNGVFWIVLMTIVGLGAARVWNVVHDDWMRYQERQHRDATRD